MNYRLVDIRSFPAQPLPGVLYWSREFEMCGHLCACGCGDFIQLPVGPVDYAITIGPKGPTLRPSVGNWDVCDNHYYITDGEVQWMPKWSPAQIAAGRAAEDARRDAYYRSTGSLWRKLIDAVRGIWRALGF